MTADAFLAALNTFSGLPDLMLRHLSSLAPLLTDAEREDAIHGISAEYAAVVHEQEEAKRAVTEGKMQIDVLKKERLPELRNASEKSEQKTHLRGIEKRLSQS